MAKYHFLQGTSVVGPLSREELERLVQKSVVTGVTMLSSDGQNWQKAGDLEPNLFSRSGSTSNASPQSGAQQWFTLDTDGKQFGPVSYTELLSWAMGGSLAGSSLVRQSSDQTWQRADQVFPHLRKQSVTAWEPTPPAKPQPEFPQVSPRPARQTSVQVTQPVDDGKEILAVVGVLALGALAIICGLAVVFVAMPAIKVFLGPAGVLAAIACFHFIRVLMTRRR